MSPRLTAGDLHPGILALLRKEARLAGEPDPDQHVPSVGLVTAAIAAATGLFLAMNAMLGVDAAVPIVILVVMGFVIYYRTFAPRSASTTLAGKPLSELPSRFNFAPVTHDEQLYLATAVSLARSPDLTYDEACALLAELNGLFDELLQTPESAPPEPVDARSILPQLIREREGETDPGIRTVLEESIALEESRLAAQNAARIKARRIAAQRRLIYQAIDAVAELAQQSPGDAMPVSMVVERVASIRHRVTAETDAREEIDALRLDQSA